MVEQKVPKDYSFRKNIFDLCVESMKRGSVPVAEVCLLHYTLSNGSKRPTTIEKGNFQID